MKHEATRQHGSPAAAIGWVATAAMLAIVVVRCVTDFSPALWWTSDPRYLEIDKDTGAFLLASFGPAGTAITDLLAMGVMGLAVLDAAVRGRRVRVAMLGLWAIGLGFALWQGSRDAESLRLGVTWAGSVAIALAAVHLGDDPAIRRIVIAALAALVVPLGLQAGYKMAVEDPIALADYMGHRDRHAAERGWTPDSSAQRKFEERLTQLEATGRFGFSNVFGSVMMTLSLVAVGAAASLAWRPRNRGDAAAWVAGAVALIGLATLAMTFSKGAVMAMVAAVGATGAVCVVVRRLPRPDVWWRLAAVGIVAAGIGGVAVRGAMGEPDSAAGERSLLFRWHYWQAAGRMVADEPVVGVGPGRFQQAYLTAKNPLNPEEVTDPHNVLVAFVATLGLGGWAWSAVLIALVWCAGGSASGVERWPSDEGAVGDGLGDDVGVFGQRGRWWLVAIAGLAAMCAQLVVERPRHEVYSAMLWLIGLGGYIGVAGWLSGKRALDGPAMRLGLFAAAAAMMLHAQIEMSLTKAMAGPVLLAVLGVAAARRGEAGDGVSRASSGRIVVGLASVGGVVAAMIVVGVTAVAPIVAEEDALARASAMRKAGSVMRDPNFDRAAMDRLQDARRVMRTDPALGEHEAMLLVEQATAAHQANQPAIRDALLDAAVAANARSIRTGSKVATGWMIRINIAERAFELTSDPAWLTRAFDAAVRRIEVDPYGIDSHVRAADLAWNLGRRDEAERYYRRALELSDLSYLDPNRQLTDDERGRIERRLAPSPTDAPLDPRPDSLVR